MRCNGFRDCIFLILRGTRKIHNNFHILGICLTVVFLQLPQSTKLIPDNDKGSFDCRQVYRRGYSTYNVDDRERRKERIYITATHNVSKKICWRSATLCVTNGASTEMPCRFWYDRQSVEDMVNWCRIDSMNFPGTGLVMQWAEDAEHPGRLNGILSEMRLRSRTTTLCVIPFF